MQPLFSFFATLVVATGSLEFTPSETKKGYTDIADANTLEIHTPSLASRKTAKIRLDNGLEALIISDPDTDQSAAALCVHVGSWSDPADAPGLAHFCEHLLFMGTEKYPEESEYHQWVKEHGGWTNAYTTNDHTCYMFAVNNSAFSDTLDRFSWFFKAPLFNPSGVERELKAIQSEFTTRLEQDASRRIHVLKTLSTNDHPYQRFTMGNAQSLANIPPERVRSWYEKHYSAELMKLVVLSPLPIEKLKETITQDFSSIPIAKKEKLSVPYPVFDTQWQGHTVYIEPVKDIQSLSLVWELPKQFAKKLKTKPTNLVGFVFGHEGENSLLQTLKEQDLADRLTAGGSDLSDRSALFEIRVSLTEKGLKNIDLVTKEIFSAITKIAQQGIPKSVFEEESKMDRIRYSFQEREDAFHTVSANARAMLYEPIETYPMHTAVLQEWDQNLISELLQQLTPEQCLFIVSAKEEKLPVTLEHKEKWFGTRYTKSAIPEQLMRSYKSVSASTTVAMPEPNPFIPESLTLIKSSEPHANPNTLLTTPSLLVNNSNWGKLYFAADDRFFTPEAHWQLHIKTPLSDPGDPLQSVLQDLYIQAVLEELNTFTYPAAMAGLSFSVTKTTEGFQVGIHGFSEHAKKLLIKILTTMADVKITKQKFTTIKKALHRQYQNFQHESALTMGRELLRSTLYQQYSSAKEKEKAIQNVNLALFTEYSKALFSRTYLEAMIFGNQTQEDAQRVWELYRQLIAKGPFPKKDHKPQKVLVLPENQGPFLLEEEAQTTGNATMLALQAGSYELKKRAAQQTLGQMMQEPFFSELRTKQQTGYIVHSTAQEMEKQLISFFAVQSATHSSRDLLSRFELFIEQYLNSLLNEDPSATKEQFLRVKESLTNQLQQPPKNMEEMASVLNLLAFDYDGNFSFLDQRIVSFENLTFADLQQFAKDTLGSKNRKRLACLIDGKVDEEVITYQKMKSPAKLAKIGHFSSGQPLD